MVRVDKHDCVTVKGKHILTSGSPSSPYTSYHCPRAMTPLKLLGSSDSHTQEYTEMYLQHRAQFTGNLN